MLAVQVLSGIRKDLSEYVGKRITLRANRGRKRVIEREGILEKTYPSVFVVKLDKKTMPERISYSYADLFTHTVEVSVNEQGHERQLVFSPAQD